MTSLASPDILVAVDVDSVELVLQVLVLYICHVVDHLQDDETRQDGQHQPLLGTGGWDRKQEVD